MLNPNKPNKEIDEQSKRTPNSTFPPNLNNSIIFAIILIPNIIEKYRKNHIRKSA